MHVGAAREHRNATVRTRELAAALRPLVYSRVTPATGRGDSVARVTTQFAATRETLAPLPVANATREYIKGLKQHRFSDYVLRARNSLERNQIEGRRNCIEGHP